jgi:hypothetical protein
VGKSSVWERPCIGRQYRKEKHLEIRIEFFHNHKTCILEEENEKKLSMKTIFLLCFPTSDMRRRLIMASPKLGMKRKQICITKLVFVSVTS